MLPSADGTSRLTAVERLRDWWQRIASRLRPARGDNAADGTRSRLVAQLRELFEDCRRQRGGEFSARIRAGKIAAIYRAADGTQRAIILTLVTHAFAPDRAALDRAIATMQSAVGDDEASRAEARLRIALDAPRARFLTQFNLLPDGVTFLVELRADLLGLLTETPALEVLHVELDSLLASWFDPGFLALERISWRSPALVLEKLMTHEAVHPIESWNDLRNRLDTDRRCYAFFHPRMPSEPLIFVEIALLKGMPSSVQALLDQSAPVLDPQTADTAVFYSISNTQRGLRGISFGNLLLKRVIEDLRRELPGLKTFATLSPLPGFRKWLDNAPVTAPGLSSSGPADDEKLADAQREPMEKLCAQYLLREKLGGQPLDPVATFHLGNGARVDRIFWRADTSERGMRQSYGMMVSYRYELADVDKNYERFMRGGEIAAAPRVLRLLD